MMTMDALQRHIEIAEARWSTLLEYFWLTPNLRHTIREAITQYQNIVKSPGDLDTATKKVFSIWDSVEEHWELVLGEGHKAAQMRLLVSLFTCFIESSLEQDYAGRELKTAERDIVILARAHKDSSDKHKVWAAEQMNTNLNQLEKSYYQKVTLPLQELMVDVGHVENKMQPFRIDGDTSNNVQSLVHASDWTGAEAELAKDQKLAEQLFKSSDGDKRRKAVLRGIERVRNKHLGKKNGLFRRTFTLGTGNASEPLPSYESASSHTEVLGEKKTGHNAGPAGK